MTTELTFKLVLKGQEQFCQISETNGRKWTVPLTLVEDQLDLNTDGHLSGTGKARYSCKFYTDAEIVDGHMHYVNFIDKLTVLYHLDRDSAKDSANVVVGWEA